MSHSPGPEGRIEKGWLGYGHASTLSEDRDQHKRRHAVTERRVVNIVVVKPCHARRRTRERHHTNKHYSAVSGAVV